ncbi:phosphoglucosamine mutase [Propionibacterium australiense]|uniref:Phosphoglucosamine mutase n=1 Tax=Propionibacterium australiense TaxID=119981 RepID=A0A383S7I0_9ACTN|nr:phosphoglucosamine mutase [Propionibacterium australiense]RLP07929.1 phosphoglucosamine mutase [Propionibacterium australiense]RLP08747.1 phosphoglucosamine mutase [Propionibacterium australiense]SYZ33329.1 phosphoglucosamine mutase [Propionibacterium australiense]VEH89768.1 Phosphoglucosamine mutase [Propionibacterium australiense]
MARLFGTDGVRGVANGDLTAELALDLSVAAAHVLGEAGAFDDRRPVAIVGRDTRISGEFLQAAVMAGLASAGVDVIDVGVIPTPGLAHLVAAQEVDLGVMLSASHNPMPDNGIKFFARGGVKLDDAIEDAIQEHLGEDWERPTGAAVGHIRVDDELLGTYIDHLVASLGEVSLKGLRVVLDCANGASSVTAVPAFEAAGAEVIGIHCSPDGLNINDGCGSTHIESLQAEVLARHADLGFAFDGDADRCQGVDAQGNWVDGDQIMAILALGLQAENKLADNTLVATVMSNLGLIVAMREHGIHVDQTKVGDRYVLENMAANGFTLGGEQSGHVIMSEFATTGDGVLTGLHVAAAVAKSGSTLAELAGVMTRLPQALVNVPDVDKLRAALDPVITSQVATTSKELGDTGRVVLRPSGTEPLVRVMVEAATQEQADEIAHRLAGVVAERVGLT